MKILKYVLGALGVLVIGFFLLGFLKSEVTYDCEIMVDKPIAEAWEVSQDVDKMADWLDGFQKIEQISGTPGEIGGISDVYFITDGQEMIIREEIIDKVPNESVTMLFTSDFMDMDYTISMADADGKTKISSTTIARGNGMTSKSILALMTSALKTQEETNLNNLKNTIESNTKDYFPMEIDSLESAEAELMQ